VLSRCMKTSIFSSPLNVITGTPRPGQRGSLYQSRSYYQLYLIGKASVEVQFGSSHLDLACRTREGRAQHWGSKAREIARRLFELAAVSALGDVAFLPGVRLEPDNEPGLYLMSCVRGVVLTLRPLGSDAASNRVPDEPAKATIVLIEDIQTYEQQED
jgi:hypothetical protein